VKASAPPDDPVPPRRTLSPALVFIGFMGAGKSTAVDALARALGRDAVDTDRLLEERFGHSVAQEFERHGEAAFRAAEEQLAGQVLEGADGGVLVALGGGAVLSERVQRALERHVTVLLDVDAAQAWERLVAQGAELRPLARDRDAFEELHLRRRPVYERLADAIVPADPRLDARRTVGPLEQLSAAPPGTRLVWGISTSAVYPVFVGRDLLESGVWPVDLDASRRFWVTDETVAALYRARLGRGELITVPSGERHKTLASAERVWRALAQGGMTRGDHVAALGGGVVGDLAGFSAATYQRGVPVVQVPTTLVAQVDSAYGGKTGVDLAEGKNYVGAYHQPAGVVVDTAALSTLAPEELAAGYAEVLKTALIAGGELWEDVARDRAVDDETILACARTKLAVVAEDERDAGRRQVLNLGHTVAHAIETATGYGRYRHGEAVALGLLASLRLSGQDELRVRVVELLVAHGLPTRLEGVRTDDVLAAVARDKKRVGPRVPFVLVAAPGDVRTGAEVGDGELRAAVAELGGA
jgi:shikimate kinase/3-dehydroquinate synthase